MITALGDPRLGHRELQETVRIMQGFMEEVTSDLVSKDEPPSSSQSLAQSRNQICHK